MRRRRKKNNLLTRIIVVSVAVHAIALPIAAHFGAFDKLKQEMGASKVVMINVPPIQEKERATQKKAKKTQTSKKGPKSTHRAGPRTPNKPNPFAPKVIASNTPGDAAGSSPAVDANGTGRAGVLPSNPPPSAPPPVPTTPPPPPKVTTAPPPPVQHTAPPPTAVAEVSKPAVPVAKKFVQVETAYAPDPTIPDDLRTEPLDKTLVVEADVSTEGLPQDVKVAESTGNSELDGIGLDTAKKYRFKPATLGDEPVVGHVRFRIIFKVE